MFVVAVLGGHKVGKTPWQPEAKMRAVAILGGIEMDFREARLPPEGVRMTCWSLLGGIKVIIPRGMAVTVSGFSFLGGKESKAAATAAPSATPGLRVTCWNVLGGLSVVEGE